MLVRASIALAVSCLLASITSNEAFQCCSSRLIRQRTSYPSRSSLNAGAPSDEPPIKKTKKLGASILSRSKSKSAESAASVAEKEDSDDYKSKTVVQLKALLKERGLGVSGLKDELIERLRQSDTVAGVPKVAAAEKSRNSPTAGFDIEDILDGGKSQNAPKKDEASFINTVGSVPLRTPSRVDENRYDDVDDENEKSSLSARMKSLFQRGDKVQALILRYGPLGASVKILSPKLDANPVNEENMVTGLVLQTEIEFYAAANEKEPRPGDIVDAYIQNIRDDGKLDIALRPVGYDKVTSAANRLLKALEDSPDGTIPLGDRSTPEEVWGMFPGLSKSQYKGAIGALLRQGAVITSDNLLTLVPEGDRKPMAAEPWSGKSPRGWKEAPPGATIFIGNLPFTMDKMKLASAIERRLGYGKLASLRLSTDINTGRGRGFAYADFYNSEYAKEALELINGLVVEGRQLRVDVKARVAKEEGVERKELRDWGESSLRGPKVYGAYTDDKKEPKKDASGTWCSVYVGNLPYKVTEESLRYSIESTMSDGQGTVADVRIAEDKDTGRKRGFAFVDFIDKPSAERACNELNGMMVMDRPLKFDLEGLKLRDREKNGGSAGADGDRSSGFNRGRENRERGSYGRGDGLDGGDRRSYGGDRPRNNDRPYDRERRPSQSWDRPSSNRGPSQSWDRPSSNRGGNMEVREGGARSYKWNGSRDERN